jgi:hypothetical protein
MASAKLVTARDFSPRRITAPFAHEPGDHLRRAANLQIVAGQQEVLVDAPAAQIAVSHADNDEHPALVFFVEAGFDANFAGKLRRNPCGAVACRGLARGVDFDVVGQQGMQHFAVDEIGHAAITASDSR